jgi:hypothetical protein
VALVDLKTNLKSLTYSSTGNGTGPYIVKPIPLTQTSTIGYSIQYPFKGQGFLSALNDDQKRMFSWFNDHRGQWALKQSSLELFNPKTEAAPITRIPDLTGANAIASTISSPLGIYLEKNGILGSISEQDKYEYRVINNNEDRKNRLVELTNRFIYQNASQTLSFLGPGAGLANNIASTFTGVISKDDPILFSYIGGPGGPITTIKKARSQNGANTFSTSFGFNSPITNQSLESSFNPFIPKNNSINTYISSFGIETYKFETPTEYYSGSVIIPEYSEKNPNIDLNNTIQTDPYELGLDNVKNKNSETNPYIDEIADSIVGISRKNLFPSIFGISNTIKTSGSINRVDYILINNKKENPNVDRINTGETDRPIRDLIKFGFGIISNDTPSNVEFLQFRAYLNNFTDNFNPSWDSVKYIGRGEEFYNYTGFSRNISFNLAFAALTRQELIPLYNKINYLASLTAPDYTNNGYIRGNIVKLTIGDYIDNQPGIIDSLSYNIEDNTMWEINLEGDKNIGQFPHVLRAQIGMKLIHNFLPKKGYNFIGVNGQYDPYEVPVEVKLRDVQPIEETKPILTYFPNNFSLNSTQIRQIFSSFS